MRVKKKIQVHAIMDQFLVEESTPTQLPPKLENLAKTLGENAVHHDYIMALVIVIMAEAEFSVTPSNLPCTDSRYIKKSLILPLDWKSERTGNYLVNFYLRSLPNHECRIVATPLGDTLIMNLMLLNRCKKVFSAAVQTVKYVNIYSSDLAGRYLNLKEFSFWFKDTLSTPARCEILSEACIANPSLPGLPAEMKLRILGMLDAYSVTRMSQTSKEFHQLSGESRIWKNLLKRDFHSTESVQNDYLKGYKNSLDLRHLLNRAAAQRNKFSIYRNHNLYADPDSFYSFPRHVAEQGCYEASLFKRIRSCINERRNASNLAGK